MKKYYLIFLLSILPLFAFTVHKFYISLIKVEYKADKESVQITMRIFIYDLQKVINETNNIDIELAVKDEATNTNILITQYIKDNFSIKINATETQFKYIGKEYENDIVYLYLELENIKTIKSIEISDTMLIDYFSTQKNIIKLNINNKNKTLLLTKGESKGEYNF